MEEADGGDGAKAAARELFEETAIKADPASLKYGRPPRLLQSRQKRQNENKDLCIYLYETDEAMKTSEMTCASMVRSAPGAPLPRKRRFQIHRIRRNRRILPHRRRKSAESGAAGAEDWGIAAKPAVLNAQIRTFGLSAIQTRGGDIRAARFYRYRDSVNLRGEDKKKETNLSAGLSRVFKNGAGDEN